jgi:hypothetical protein
MGCHVRFLSIHRASARVECQNHTPPLHGALGAAAIHEGRIVCGASRAHEPPSCARGTVSLFGREECLWPPVARRRPVPVSSESSQ